MKIKKLESYKAVNHKHDRIGVGRIRKVPFSSDSAYYDSVAYDLVKTRLSESEAEVER